MVALMGHQGIDRALVASWLIGVNIAIEMCHRHPERVAGILAVAGVPGGTFSTMGGPLRIPRRMRKPIATRVAKLMRGTAGAPPPGAARPPAGPPPPLRGRPTRAPRPPAP